MKIITTKFRIIVTYIGDRRWCDQENVHGSSTILVKLISKTNVRNNHFVRKFLSELFHSNNLKRLSQNKLTSRPVLPQNTHLKFKLLLNDYQVLQIQLMCFSPVFSNQLSFCSLCFSNTDLLILTKFANLIPTSGPLTCLTTAYYFYHKSIIALLYINLLSEYLRTVVGMERKKTTPQKDPHV